MSLVFFYRKIEKKFVYIKFLYIFVPLKHNN